MNSWGLNCLEVDITVANPQRRRGLDLDLDLNYPLPPQMRALDLSLGLSSYNNSSQQVQVQAQVHGWSLSHHHQVTNAASEVLDDDEVAIISPRTFAQSREISEGNHSHGKRGVLREATGTPRGRLAAAILCTNCKTRMPDDCQPCLKPGTSNKKERNVFMTQQSPQSVSSAEDPIFSCAVCIGPLIEPTSTRCGHIFCKECLQRSLKSSQNKCPTCRQKVGKRGIFRVYLPTTN